MSEFVPKKEHLPGVLLQGIVHLWMFTATMFHWRQLVDIGSNASKVVISMSRVKNAMVSQKSSEIRSLRNCLLLIHVRHLNNCLQHWMLIDLLLEDAYMRWEWFRRQELGYYTS
ncbi:hypothetical protein Trydic_g3643 [Trypoxylus dichotomus]